MLKQLLVIVGFIGGGCVPLCGFAAVLGAPASSSSAVLGPADATCHLTACFQNGRYALSSIDGKTSMVYHYWKNQDFSLKRSRKIAQSFMPSDAKLLRSYTKDSGTFVEVFISNRVGTSFGKKSAAWSGGTVGAITVMHASALGKTIVATGESE